MAALAHEHDIMVVERRDDVRIIVSLPGRFILASRRDALGNRREFSCRLVNISSQAIALATPINGPIGERVILQVEQFGRVEGKIIRVLDHGFVIAVVAGEDERAKLLSKIVWFDQHINYEKLDDRTSKRIVPRNPHSTIVLSDGSVVCTENSIRHGRGDRTA